MTSNDSSIASNFFCNSSICRFFVFILFSNVLILFFKKRNLMLIERISRNIFIIPVCPLTQVDGLPNSPRHCGHRMEFCFAVHVLIHLFKQSENVKNSILKIKQNLSIIVWRIKKVYLLNKFFRLCYISHNYVLTFTNHMTTFWKNRFTSFTS